MESFRIYITSNEVGKTRTFHIGKSALKSILALAALSCLLFIAILFDYIALRIEQPEYSQAKTEYQFLISNLQYVENELNSLENQLQKVDQLTDKIEVIQEYYSKGPIAAMSTPTEYFSVDYVAIGGGSRRPTRVLGGEFDRGAWVENRNRLLPRPLFDSEKQMDNSLSIKMTDRIEVAAQNTQSLERKVMQLWENLSERQNFIRATPSIRPTNGWFSSRFGVRADPFTGKPTMHSGLDLASRYGAAVIATADGIVRFVGYQNGYGNIVTIDHGYGIQTRYAHNSKIYVKRGQSVRRYDAIAAVGSSGRSTGAHCHYEVRVRGVAVDPINYILDF